MKVIKVLFKNNSLIVEELYQKNFEDSNNIMYFTLKYIKYNKDKVKELLNSGNAGIVIYKDFDSFLTLYDIINIKNIKFDTQMSLTRRELDKLLTMNINSIECFFMPSDYVHELTMKGVKIKLVNNLNFSLEFIVNNNFKNLKNIYYRKSVRFYSVKEVKENLVSFLSVSNSLCVIDLYFYDDKIIEEIVNNLINYKFYNVDILIHQNSFNEESIKKDINHLKKLNKTYNKVSEGEIKIIYSEEFFNNKIFRELTINGLKICAVFLMYASIVIIGSSKYHEYISYLNQRKLEEEMRSNISIDEINDDDVTEVVEVPVENEEPVKVYVNQYANVPKNFKQLLNINKDVKGYITVNNTKINYPVLQYTDNEYYLKHDIYGTYMITGWIFMDYRNDSTSLSKNTIIYGHNTRSGYMFGDLKNALDYGWYTSPNNQIITFNTLNKEMKWKIFSVYRSDAVTDYLKVDFYNDEQFMNYINTSKSKSIYDFKVDVKFTDKILTLSTCSGNNRRLVVQAVLINE